MPRQELRDYQARGVEQIFAKFREGARSVLVVSPTGSGKTTIFGHLCSQLADHGKPSLINVHRRELAMQAVNRLREFGADFGIIMAGEPRRPQARIQVASVQTLVRRLKHVPPAALVVNDEAHLSTAETWQSIMNEYPHARILGFTATPWRTGGKPLIGRYDSVVVVATPAELREQGHLCDYVGFSYKTPDLSGIKTTGGDYNEQQSAAVMSDSLIVDNVVEEWVKHASHLSTVVFAVTVEHSKTLCERFRAAGVAAEHLDGGTPKLERESILRRVSEGHTRVLCNVGVAVEGLDIPRLKCCVLARPTKSLARAIQMMGRVRRPWNGVTARIHDHAFVIQAHGLPDDDRDYSLNAREENPKPVSVCSFCLAQYRGDQCPACNRAPVVNATDREIKTVKDAEQIHFTSEDSKPAEVSRKPVEVKWSDPGRVVEGVYERTWEDQTSYGPLRSYFLRGTKRNYVFHGTTDLNARMASVTPGTLIRVTYLRNLELGGGKVKKLFKVEIDDGT